MNLKRNSGRLVAEYTSKFQNLINRLTSVGMKLEDEMQALLLLSSLLVVGKHWLFFSAIPRPRLSWLWNYPKSSERSPMSSLFCASSLAMEI